MIFINKLGISFHIITINFIIALLVIIDDFNYLLIIIDKFFKKVLLISRKITYFVIK